MDDERFDSFTTHFSPPPGDSLSRQREPTARQVPLKVRAICLPFVFVKLPSGEFKTIDVRLVKLARVKRKYARMVWKAHKPPTPKPVSTV